VLDEVNTHLRNYPEGAFSSVALWTWMPDGYLAVIKDWLNQHQLRAREYEGRKHGS
jgi:hypothetical protein